MSVAFHLEPLDSLFCFRDFLADLCEETGLTNGIEIGMTHGNIGNERHFALVVFPVGDRVSAKSKTLRKFGQTHGQKATKKPDLLALEPWLTVDDDSSNRSIKSAMSSSAAIQMSPCIVISASMRAQWRDEQERRERDIERHRAADDSYMDQGIQILNLGQNAHHLFARQPAKEKRSLLNFLLSNSTWAQGKLADEV